MTHLPGFRAWLLSAPCHTILPPPPVQTGGKISHRKSVPCGYREYRQRCQNLSRPTQEDGYGKCLSVHIWLPAGPEQWQKPDDRNDVSMQIDLYQIIKCEGIQLVRSHENCPEQSRLDPSCFHNMSQCLIATLSLSPPLSLFLALSLLSPFLPPYLSHSPIFRL